MNILILDDTKYRHKWFAQHYSNESVAHSYNYNDFVEKLSSKQWNLIHLDYDLADDVKDPSIIVENGISRECNGLDAAIKIAQLEDDKLPNKVIIHSLNYKGSQKMLEVLKERGIKTDYKQFGDHLVLNL